MPLRLALVCVLLVSACSSAPPPAASSPPAATVRSATATLDSLVVDRGACFGTCPVDQILLARDGSFAIREHGEAIRRANVGASFAAALLDQATTAGLLTLPAQIMGDAQLCPITASDHPTIVLTAFTGASGRRVVHYTGCYASAEAPRVVEALVPLTALERRLRGLADSVRAAARSGS